MLPTLSKFFSQNAQKFGRWLKKHLLNPFHLNIQNFWNHTSIKNMWKNSSFLCFMWKKLNFHLPKGLQKVKFRRQAWFFSRWPNFSVRLAVNFCQELATQLLLGEGEVGATILQSTPLSPPPSPPLPPPGPLRSETASPPPPISWVCRNSCAQGVRRPGPGNDVAWRKGDMAGRAKRQVFLLAACGEGDGPVHGML